MISKHFLSHDESHFESCDESHNESHDESRESSDESHDESYDMSHDESRDESRDESHEPNPPPVNYDHTLADHTGDDSQTDQKLFRQEKAGEATEATGEDFASWVIVKGNSSCARSLLINTIL